MAGNTMYRRRVGSVRPSHLMFTSGVGALVDLPNFTVLVRGLDKWRYDLLPSVDTGETGDYKVHEPRLLAAVRRLRGEQVRELRAAPWLPGTDSDPSGLAARTGVPVMPFPAWLRCSACNVLAPIENGVVFDFENDKPRKPHEARFFHTNCTRVPGKRKPLAVPARFLLVCTAGHLDEFPYSHFVHRGGACPEAANPILEMDDRGGNVGADVEIRCQACEERRNIREAMERRGAENLPACRGRHPHLTHQFTGPCDRPPKVLVLGASNQWFAQTLSALAVPEAGADELAEKIRRHWSAIAPLPAAMYPYARENIPAFRELEKWTDAEIAAAVERHRAALDRPEPEQQEAYPDLRTPEWRVFTTPGAPSTEDFSLYRPGIAGPLTALYQDVVQVERVREVRALIGFTRLDAPDPEEPDLVTSVQLGDERRPGWIPAGEVRGEGVFLRVREDLLADWEERVRGSDAMRAHREAYARFRENRYSDRIRQDFDPMRHWPGYRYYALHTLSHLLIRTIALECGYSSASLAERIYAGTEDDPRGGILIYTAVPDAEGTLGGLVSLAEPDRLLQLTRRALADARHCSSDPLCGERLPAAPADFLHGAACHVCLFVSETTCERGNRFLDRRFVVPIDDAKLALLAEAPRLT